MTALIPFWLAGEPGAGLVGTIVALVAGSAHAVVVIAGASDRGAGLWLAVLPVSLGVALPACFIAESPAMRRLLAMIDPVMRTDATVLIEGETGSGKELVARAIHDGSVRCTGPFVAVNCAAIPDGLAESELFGHERGAFTGALQARPGWFEQASGGTVLLDEVGETPLGVQAKLLRVLQEREVRRVGGRRPVRIDVRILAATNRTLTSLVQARRFREDLYHRLHVVTLAVPPLRERSADLVPLARHFLAVHAATAQKTLTFSAEALERMREYPWPGNVRELEHAVQRAAVLAPGPHVTREDLGLDEPDGGKRPTSSASPALFSVVDADGLLTVLDRYQGNRRAAARALGIDRSTLWRKLRQHTASLSQLEAPPD